MSATDSQIPVQPRLPAPPQELCESSSHLLKKLGHAVKERLLAGVEEIGLSGYDHAILALLKEEPREAQGTIADALGLDRSHLVGVLDDLEERGLIERRRDPADRRRHLVSLTPAGEEALTHVRAVVKRIDDEFFKPLDPAERKTLAELLRRLAGHHDARYRTNAGS